MQNRVEPPVLISRLLTFVLATALVVLGVLCLTIYNMFPLNRPQVFFLATDLRDDLEIRLIELPPQDEHLDNYKKAFIREYIRARNEVITNQKVMHRKWNGTDGVVKIWSTDDVYSDFASTAMFNAMMSEMPDFEFSCPVEFETGAVQYLANDDGTYQVKFRYFCTNNTGPVAQKDYTIKLKLVSEDNAKIKWADRVENPLGLRVAEYTIASENGDPLDTGFLPGE